VTPASDCVQISLRVRRYEVVTIPFEFVLIFETMIPSSPTNLKVWEVRLPEMKGEQEMRRYIASVATAASLSLAAFAGPAMAATQDGLVNVYVNDVEIAKDVNVNVVANVVATVCANVDADVNALASQVDQTDAPATIDCKSSTDKIEILQN